MVWFVLGIISLTILDIWVTKQRIEKYGPGIELNPIVRDLARKDGITPALVFLAWWNVGILIPLVHYEAETLLHIFFGLKLGLALLQVKSIVPSK